MVPKPGKEGKALVMACSTQEVVKMAARNISLHPTGIILEQQHNSSSRWRQFVPYNDRRRYRVVTRKNRTLKKKRSAT